MSRDSNPSERKVVLVIGDGDYQRDQLSRILTRLAGTPDPGKANCDVFLPERQQWRDILESVRTYSLFGTPRFFIIRDAAIFKAEGKADDTAVRVTAAADSGDWESAARLMVKLLGQLDLDAPEYETIRDNPAAIADYFRDAEVDAEVLADVMHRYPPPETMPARSAPVDYDAALASIPEGHFLIVTVRRTDCDKRLKAFKSFQRHAEVCEQPPEPQRPQDVRRSREEQLRAFLDEHRKKAVDAQVATFLRERFVETPTPRMALEKLLFVIGGKDAIEMADLMAAFDDDLAVSTLQLTEFIRTRDRSGIAALMNRGRGGKQEMIQLCGFLRSALRNTLLVRDLAPGRMFDGFHDFESGFYRKFGDHLPRKKDGKAPNAFFMFQCLSGFAAYRDDRLRTAYLALFEIERVLKSTQRDPVDELTVFFNELLR